MKVEKLDHVHIYVKDIERAVQLFEHWLGIKFGPIYTWDEWGLKDCYAPPGLLLMQPTSPDDAMDAAKFIERRGEGLSGISVKVQDIEAGIAELEAKGLRLRGKVQVGNVVEAMFHSEESFGLEIELAHYPGDDIGAAASSEMLSRAVDATQSAR